MKEHRPRYSASVPNLARLCGDEDAPSRLVVRIGDWVGFKADVEQQGRILDIRTDSTGATVLVLTHPSGFSGDYIGGDRVTRQHASDCWTGDPK